MHRICLSISTKAIGKFKREDVTDEYKAKDSESLSNSKHSNFGLIPSDSAEE